MTDPTAEAAKLLPSRMRMADVKVGMRLVSTIAGGPAFSPITVTEITERGFRYKLDVPVCLHPLMGTTEGGEHFGHDGECYYEPEPESSSTKEVMPDTGQLRQHNATPPASTFVPGASAMEPEWDKVIDQSFFVISRCGVNGRSLRDELIALARQAYRLGLTRAQGGKP